MPADRLLPYDGGRPAKVGTRGKERARRAHHHTTGPDGPLLRAWSRQAGGGRIAPQPYQM